ncbi:hypothetical protein RJT34_09384 [Clitoria ternatea]|uniref:Uncharacterized protein n=1 Tax=Clitoria ternatea TaxID=43366 RepID=A0AAN9K6W6_CLITE
MLMEHNTNTFHNKTLFSSKLQFEAKPVDADKRLLMLWSRSAIGSDNEGRCFGIIGALILGEYSKINCLVKKPAYQMAHSSTCILKVDARYYHRNGHIGAINVHNCHIVTDVALFPTERMTRCLALEEKKKGEKPAYHQNY